MGGEPSRLLGLNRDVPGHLLARWRALQARTAGFFYPRPGTGPAPLIANRGAGLSVADRAAHVRLTRSFLVLQLQLQAGLRRPRPAAQILPSPFAPSQSPLRRSLSVQAMAAPVT